jgi:radical SAM superfamily enzyme YgiQ (UPF0313 family)
MKITLIEPSAPDYHIFSMFHLPRLGLPILGTILKEKGHKVNIYVEGLHPIDYDEVYRSDLVGISSITSTAPRAYSIAEQVRKKGIPVVIGGSHVTFLPDEALKYVDYVVRGEGEETLLELVDSIQDGKHFADILGLSYRNNGSYLHNPQRPLIPDLDMYPYPDFSLIQGIERVSSIPLQISRGCPFNCSFCSVTKMFGRKYRFRNMENVIEEIIFRLKSFNSPPWFFFYDDNFTANPNQTKIFLEEILRKKIKFSWTAQTRSDVVRDRELMNLMKRTNCQCLYIGFESVNPETLKLYNKRQLVDEIRQAIKIIHNYGIRIHGMFVLGSDEDDVKIIKNTTRFVKKNKIDTVQYLILTPIPGTEVYNQMKRENRLLTTEWNLYDGLHVVFQPVKMTAYQLQKEAIKAMRKFYSFFKSLTFLIKGKFYLGMVRFKGSLIIQKWQKRKKEFLAGLKKLHKEHK